MTVEFGPVLHMNWIKHGMMAIWCRPESGPTFRIERRPPSECWRITSFTRLSVPPEVASQSWDTLVQAQAAIEAAFRDK